MADIASALDILKLSLGIMSQSATIDNYYNNYLSMAKNDILTYDISEKIYNVSDTGVKTENVEYTELFKECQVLYAKALVEDRSPEDDNSVKTLTAKLSDLTRGNYYENIEEVD